MTLTPEQKEHAVELIVMGEKLDAVRYLQETLSITAEQALVLTEKLEEEVESPSLPDELKTFREEAFKQPSLDVGRLVGSIFFGIGLILLGVVVYLSVAKYQFAQRAVPVSGKVIGYSDYQSKNSEGGGSTTMYTPTFQYSFKGATYTFESSTSSSSRNYEIGDAVEMLMDPNDPSRAIVNSFWEEWFVSVLLGFMGSAFAGAGYVVFRVFSKKQRDAKMI